MRAVYHIRVRVGWGSEPCGGMFDVRLNLRGKKGGSLVLETSSEVLFANSEVFAGLILEYRKGLGPTGDSKISNDSSKMCRIEVSDVENLGVFRDTIELMFEDNITKRLLKIGVYRAIDILEAVPWSEEEEEKLRVLFSVFKFEETATQDILARLYLRNSVKFQQNLSRQLVWSIATCTYANARNELKPLVKDLFCKSSIYEKDQPELSKEDLYIVCLSCLSSLVTLLEEASNTSPNRKATKRETGKPLLERISRQVDNINWLLEILLDQQMGEEFVDMWADQGELLKMHETTSPMIRYELSRISAALLIAMGTRKLHCRSEARRASPGMVSPNAIRFWCFSKLGTECPNLSKAFQVADFSLAKFLPGANNVSHITSVLRGTNVYADPEYGNIQKVSKKSDVYSFGVVLLELITGKKPLFGENEDDNIVHWAKSRIAEALNNKKYTDFVDSRLQGAYDKRELHKMISCAAACVSTNLASRPNMRKVKIYATYKNSYKISPYL
ncbi:hypothetical protein GH714_021757 [Hevea brasiliensis]|uniref:Protein kinase domain-containing protein n=1 Tax=Hevea brasiliensis TaxID=3981 RepID=A0A6A6K8R4_HEVBR|nr:hypothetical protein GH714_021757 [Hevea brasiliensis]